MPEQTPAHTTVNPTTPGSPEPANPLVFRVGKDVVNFCNIAKRRKEAKEAKGQLGNWQAQDDFEMTGRPEAVRQKEVEMGVEKQVAFGRIAIDRWLISASAAPDPNNKRYDQEFDVWAKYLSLEMATQSGIDISSFVNRIQQGEPVSDKEIAEYISKHAEEIRLTNLDSEARAMAYRLVRVTMLEAQAALALESRNVVKEDDASIMGGIIRDVTKSPDNLTVVSPLPGVTVPVPMAETGSAVGAKFYRLTKSIKNSDVFLGIAARYHRIPKNDRMDWKRQRQGSHITAFEPLSVAGYQSAYTGRILSHGTEAGVAALQKIVQSANLALTDYHEAVAKAAFGMDRHDQGFAKLFDMTTTNPNDLKKGSEFKLKADFARALIDTLKETNNVDNFDGLSYGEKMHILLQSERRAGAVEGKGHMAAILTMQSDHGFWDHNITEGKERLEKLTVPETLPSDVEAKKATTTYDDLNKVVTERDTAIANKAKIAEIDVGIKQQETQKHNKEQTITSLQAQLDDDKDESGKKLAVALRNSMGNQIAKIQAEIAAIDRFLEDEGKKKDTITTSVEIAERTLIDLLESNYPEADVKDKIIIVDANTHKKSIVETELRAYLSAKKNDSESKQRKAQTEKEDTVKGYDERKKIGTRVLDIIKTQRDIAIDRIEANAGLGVPLEVTSDYHKFTEFLGFSKDNIGSDKVLPPWRLARILTMYLEIDAINPRHITAEKVDSYWPQIAEAFNKKDAHAQAKAVVEIYNDRVRAILDKNDPFDDILHYEPTRRRELLVERATFNEFHEEAWEREGKIMGVDALMEVVSVDGWGNVAVVAENGEVKIYPVREKADGKFGFGDKGKPEPIHDLKITKTGGTDYALENPGEKEVLDMKLRLLAGYSRDQLRLLLNGADLQFTTLDAKKCNVKKDGKGNLTIEVAGVAVADTDSFINEEMQRAIAARQAGGVLLGLGGEYVLTNIVERSKNLQALKKAKGQTEQNQGFQEDVRDPLNVPDQIVWQIDDKTGIAIVFTDITHPDKVVVKSVKRDSSDKEWTNDTSFITSSTKKTNMSLDELVALGDADDPDGRRRIIPACFFDSWMRMSPPQRQLLGVGDVGVNITAEMLLPEFNGPISVSLNDRGEPIVLHKSGYYSRFLPLATVLNTAVYGNKTKRYDGLSNGVTPNNSEMAKLQADIGVAVMKAILRKKQQPS